MVFVRDADRALYRAKRLGKNSVVGYSEVDERSQA
jgi:PleD family two-component response regulator